MPHAIKSFSFLCCGNPESEQCHSANRVTSKNLKTLHETDKKYFIVILFFKLRDPEPEQCRSANRVTSKIKKHYMRLKKILHYVILFFKLRESGTGTVSRGANRTTPKNVQKTLYETDKKIFN
jgi:hypothetical protein